MTHKSKGATPTGQRMIFTGPDGVGNYRPRLHHSPQYVGVGSLSPEATGDLTYLTRAAPHAPPPLPKHALVGEVGWGWQYNQLVNSETLHSGMQIKKTDVRIALEERASHMFQPQQ
ncbi:protein SPMIP2 [Nerophis lumbriciformis]|uniref:protein SPMIP2 n=1 Tax=Nerophis lumbriciformis TaxID=546530 RepID=UPI002AE0632C|nr:protein SPMIP2-like [Nerophis lumbriciformis]